MNELVKISSLKELQMVERQSTCFSVGPSYLLELSVMMASDIPIILK